MVREEVARLSELKAAMRAKEQSRKRLQREEAHNMKVQRAAEAAAAKAAEATEKARKANDLQEAHIMRMMGIAESAHGCQCHRGSVDIQGCEAHGRLIDFSAPCQQQLPAFVAGSPSPFTTIVANSKVPSHHFGTHLQSTLSSDPTTSHHQYTL